MSILATASAEPPGGKPTINRAFLRTTCPRARGATPTEPHARPTAELAMKWRRVIMAFLRLSFIAIRDCEFGPFEGRFKVLFFDTRLATWVRGSHGLDGSHRSAPQAARPAYLHGRD